MDNSFPFNGLLEILKRVLHSGYKTILMHDRMMMNCYNVDEDDDIGTHYVLHIPETNMYQSDFYQLDLIIDISAIAEATKQIRKDHETYRKSKKIRPKDASILCRYDLYKRYLLLSIDFMLKDEVWKTVEIKIPYPISNMDPIKSNIETAYNTMLERIDISSPPVIINGLTEDIPINTLDRVRVFYYLVEINNRMVKIPFLKSFFRSINKFEQFDISIQKTLIKNVYLVVHTFGSKGLTDQYIMYVEDFDKQSAK